MCLNSSGSVSGEGRVGFFERHRRLKKSLLLAARVAVHILVGPAAATLSPLLSEALR